VTCLACAAAAVLLGSSLGAGGADKASAGGEYPKVDKAKHETYVEKITDEVKFTMVAVPGGSYMMGSPKDEKKRNADEGPQHPVKIPPFWMGKCEVTWDEFDWFWTKRFPGGQPPPRPDIAKKPEKLSDAITSPTPPYADETFGHGRPGYPVLAISHHAAMEYCRWLTEKTGKKYRLPTEAEWEWACRAGTTTAYSFGDDSKKLGDYAWIEDNCDEHPHPVGKKKANPWGLHDMYGNVAEWCIDRYSKDFYGRQPGDILTNPFNPPTENRYPDVARGGSWIDTPDKCRSAARMASNPKWLKRDPQSPKSIWWMTEADYVGFRVVRSVTDDERLTKIRSLVTWWSPD
jgi:formylglycine-generating enzyme required for sulfatase activity